jgi:hypothetical protein
VATYSTILGLKLSDESDPFQLADFIQNWELLDTSPGTFICSSTSRPSWNSSQAGRLIFMTDLKQVAYWSGTAWSDLIDASPVFAGGSYINKLHNPGANAITNILSFTTPRPCALAIWLSGTYNCPNNKTQDAWQSAVFDGVQQTMGGYREQLRFAGNAGDSAANLGTNATSMALIPSVSAGKHTIGVEVQVSSSYSTAINLVGCKTLAMIGVYSSSNSL